MLAREARRIVLEQSKRANVGQIGSALSIADIIAALYGGAISIESPQAEEHDRFILSNGHAALALYAALHLRRLGTHCGAASIRERSGLCGVHSRCHMPVVT